MKEPPKIDVPVVTTLTLLLLDAEDVGSPTITLPVEQAKDMREQADRSCMWLAWQESQIRQMRGALQIILGGAGEIPKGWGILELKQLIGRIYDHAREALDKP
jgi:hypothetical protein